MKTVKNTKGWSAKEENKPQVNKGVSKVHNLIIVDESGSMRILYNAALTGMNRTIQSIVRQAKECPGQEQEVTLVTFDSNYYNTIFDSTPALKTRQITREDYRPNGATPLYDAMGKAINDLRPKVKENEAVLVTVITDGMENASCEFTLADIKALIEKLDSEGWLFSYIGANQDAEAVGDSMGIKDNLNYDANEDSMAIMWDDMMQARDEFIVLSREQSFKPTEFQRGSFFKKK